MSDQPQRKSERRTRQRAANRAAILDAARRVSARTELGEIALRAVAAEAGYAPASVYEYFRNRGELVLALAADDLGQIARTLKDLPASGNDRLAAAARAVLDLVKQSGALAASSATFEDTLPAEAERLFNGKLIAALTALAEAAGRAPKSRADQADVVLIAAAVAGLAMLARSGRLKALGFDEQELLTRLEARFPKP